MRVLAILLLCSFWASAADAPRVVYSKEFKGSTPPLVIITVERDGKAEYREELNDPQPVHFQLTKEETEEIFSLTEKLERFKRPLESGLKVANLGLKTFRFEHGVEKNEVKYNYSLDENAKVLNDWFERIVETQMRMFDLERTTRYDKLGVDKALLLLEASFDRKRLVAVQQFLPILERIQKNRAFLDRARDRAGRLAEVFRTGGISE